MICDIVQIDLLLLVFCQHPLSVLNVFVKVGPWLQLEWDLVVLLDLVEDQAGVGFPFIPTAADEDLLWTGDGLCLEAETVQFTLQSWCVLQYSLELLNMVPLFPPILPFIEAEQLEILILLGFPIRLHSQLLNLPVHLLPINVNLILHAIELIIPPSGNILLLDDRLCCIFSQFLVGWLILITL